MTTNSSPGAPSSIRSSCSRARPSKSAKSTSPAGSHHVSRRPSDALRRHPFRPASSSVLLRPGKHTVSKYWDFDPGKRIRYRTDAEYEEHFRTVFATAVQRRLRSDRPVLAELSGGMDSSSIVCMADTSSPAAQPNAHASTPSLGSTTPTTTLEPDTNELHWSPKSKKNAAAPATTSISAELKARELSHRNLSASEFDNDRFAATPISQQSHLRIFQAVCGVHEVTRISRHALRNRRRRSYRRRRANTYTRTPKSPGQSTILYTRSSTERLGREDEKTAAPFALGSRSRIFSLTPIGLPKQCEPAPGFILTSSAGITPLFAVIHSRVKLFGPLPSFQDHIDNLDG